MLQGIELRGSGLWDRGVWVLTLGFRGEGVISSDHKRGSGLGCGGLNCSVVVLVVRLRHCSSKSCRSCSSHGSGGRSRSSSSSSSRRRRRRSPKLVLLRRPLVPDDYHSYNEFIAET